MIVCSCNVFSDQQLRSILAKVQRLRTSQVYDRLGCSVQCGRCAHTVKRIMEQVANCAIASGSPSANLHARTQQRARSSWQRAAAPIDQLSGRATPNV